ncbi:hypothetical protein VNO80_27161 [Phaseolus coccineus]|uniref:Uncharacterized protein n=1 Tax=Phaseolus coccineus TaxID=3886 RepID=A0AAN9LJT0_PHACN
MVRSGRAVVAERSRVIAKRMGRTKSIAAQTAKGKRVRIDSNSPETQPRNQFSDREKQQRYEEIRIGHLSRKEEYNLISFSLYEYEVPCD